VISGLDKGDAVLEEIVELLFNAHGEYILFSEKIRNVTSDGYNME
jgi:hypothetical protein